jgi:predicted ATPase/DNA-binding winged helix-turn-helix (wHTH) protein
MADKRADVGGRAVVDDDIAFGDFLLQPSMRRLTRNGSLVMLGGRAIDLLITLARRPGETLSKSELFALVWPNTSIEESSLRVQIAALRKALGDDPVKARFIASVPGRGYVFVAEIDRRANGSAARGRSELPSVADIDTRPAPLGKIIGRDAAVHEIADHLKSRRLVTISGPGGVGKTAVALAVGHHVAHRFRDGVTQLDLAPLENPALVAAHLASLLGLPTLDADPLEFVISYLHTRNKLLILDNCEHIVDAVAGTIEMILQGAPDITVLTTSRAPLRARSEWVHRLAPLAVPPMTPQLSASEARRFAAVELLEERGAACGTGFRITDDNAAEAAELCTRLDGLPLAIELAATRIPILGLKGLVDRLDDRFGILTKGHRTADARHQTLTALIDWSYDTLSEDERTVWSRLAIYRDAFTIEAADAIGNDRPRDSFNIVDILDSLIEKSLVALGQRSPVPKYRLLETLRLYASAKLDERGEAACVRRRHAEYWLQTSAKFADNWIETPSPERLSRHRGELADIRGALDWALGPEGDAALGAKLAAASAPLWFKMLLLPELRRNLERVIELAPEAKEIDDKLLMRLNIALAHAIFHGTGSINETLSALRKALELAKRNDDLGSELPILWAIWGAQSTYGDYSSMRPVLERVDQIRSIAPELPVAPLYDRMAALTSHLVGTQDQAVASAKRALAHAAVARRARQDGAFVYDHRTATSAHYARSLWLAGQPEKAQMVICEIVEQDIAKGQSFALGFFLALAALPISFWAGDLNAARHYLTTLLDARSGITFNVWQMSGRVYERALLTLENADRRVAARTLIETASLTPFQADSLSTFSPLLLCPDSVARATADEVAWCTAEVLRAQGERLISSHGPAAHAEAEPLFRRAINLSREQKARAWELRAATSLTRLMRDQNRAEQGRSLLAPVYERFPDGLATLDLIEARDLLGQL